MNLNRKVLIWGTTAVIILSLFAGCSVTGKPQSPPDNSQAPTDQGSVETPSPTVTVQVTKEDIQKSIDALGSSAYDITWSPDNTLVAFIKEDNGTGNIYVWKTGQQSAKLISVAENTTDGFLWAPDSRHFLINVGHMGPGTITSTLVDSESLEIVASEITSVSISPPVWSPDGKYLALSRDNQNEGIIEIYIYAIASNTQVSVQKSSNTFGPYCISYWKDATIGYTEMTSSGERVEKIIEVGD